MTELTEREPEVVPMVLTIDADEDDMELAVGRVLELLREGYTSGIEPCWELKSP